MIHKTQKISSYGTSKKWKFVCAIYHNKKYWDIYVDQKHKRFIRITDFMDWWHGDGLSGIALWNLEKYWFPDYSYKSELIRIMQDAIGLFIKCPCKCT